MIEEWKDVPGTDGKYAINREGIVKSKERMIYNGQTWHLFKEREVKTRSTKSGEVSVAIMIGKNLKWFKVKELLKVTFGND